MTSIQSLVVLLVSLTLCFKFASSIFCYDCNSAFDPRCGENFDSFSLGVVNCSLRDPPDHIEPLEPTFCRIIKMEIYGKVRIVRQCGYIEEENGEHMCRRQTGNGDLFVTYCTCDTDLCNSSTKLSDHTIVASMVFLYGILNVKYIL
ncbi:uncharacterized protein LOC112050068 [Bicyclus anynana]|uniref:Uncharacterized protein LOC112050068 n=1 Tax=Bicyclus anynana TaxID=110368 RepID=A0A6J1NAM8_BICAN|nr:uncharacterized protein LOC112050068 [Bicyclus anynana]